MGSTGDDSGSGGLSSIPRAASDPLFGMKAEFFKDHAETKVAVIVGAYRDGSGKPWKLPVVREVTRP